MSEAYLSPSSLGNESLIQAFRDFCFSSYSDFDFTVSPSILPSITNTPGFGNWIKVYDICAAKWVVTNSAENVIECKDSSGYTYGSTAISPVTLGPNTDAIQIQQNNGYSYAGVYVKTVDGYLYIALYNQSYDSRLTRIRSAFPVHINSSMAI